MAYTFRDFRFINLEILNLLAYNFRDSKIFALFI